ncbi:MAG: PilC/PilY family type IV pilus protein [Halofilum sp. (in: g-proteobacteria)]|nr:PilC/PilY family type IV pilus protein [Halofilum sp. (in: g-proteobacteria)]
MKHDKRNATERTFRGRLGAFTGALVLSASTLFSTTAQAAQIPISDLPLFLGVTVRPNVFFEVDDSGSMDFQILTTRYWHACAYDSNAPAAGGSDDCESLQDNGLFLGYDGGNYDLFYYMSADDDSVYNRLEVWPHMPAITDADWRIQSSDFNTLYYNPTVAYEPWPGESDQSFTAAREDPRSGTDGFNDTHDLTGITFAIWEDDRGYSGGRPHRGADAAPQWFGVNTNTSNSGTQSAFVNGSGEAVLGTESIDASGGSAGTFDVWVRKGDDAFSEDPEGAENLVLEYRSNSGTWVQLESFPASAADGQIFNRSYTLPADALHSDLRFRFRLREGSGAGFDFWHIDDVTVSVDGSNVFSDDFESGSLAAAQWGDLAVNATNTPNGEIDLWDSHKLVTVNGSSVDVTTVSYSPDTTGLNRSASTVNLTSDAAIQTELGYTLAELKQNIANWFSFGRRRSLVAKSSIGSVLEAQPNFRYGLSVLNRDNELFVEVPTATSGDFSSHNDTLYDALKDFDFPSAGTPLKEGLERTGQYFDDELSGRDNPIVHECQKNFAILMSDGHWSAGSTGVNSDEDGDGFSDTVADTARFYYEKDLSPLPNEVPPDPADPANWQHLVTFPVAFGVEGVLRDTDGDGWPDPDLDEDDSWGDPTTCSFQQCPEKIDDMWHAAFNSKGTFVSAKTPAALTEALTDAVETVAKRDSSAAAVAVNSGSFQTGSKLFQARFNSNDWSGDLLAFGLTETTSPQDPTLKLVFPDDTPTWEAADLLDNRNPDNRDLITFKQSTAEGIPFAWPADPANPTVDELDTAQSDALDINPESNVADGLGESRLEYLRGDQSLEVSNGGNFRTRSTVLGDLINSAPVFVGDPNFLYPESWPGAAPPETSYSAFIQAEEGRTPMVYVGGNDGIFHGFNADTGEEVFGFMPNAIYGDLNELTSQDYGHRFFVDGSPTYADVFFNNAWHSVIASGLKKGGQAVFALDVTDPSILTENSADNVVLWEFGDEVLDRDSDGNPEGDPDLGYSFSQPSLVRLQNGRWGAVFGNGYNNTEPDGSASSTGNAVLYIVDVATGELIRKIDTGVGTADDPENNNRPNGLATPAVVDTNGDSVADYVFAGDIFGNLWKFDIRDSNPTNWGSYVESGNAPAPMFTAVSPDSGDPRQPITSRPQVGRHPAGLGGLMIYFGTGKYIGSDDNTQIDQDTQTFYAVWDRTESNGNQNIFDRSDLLQQTIDAEVSVTRTSAFFTDDDGNPEQTTSELRVTSDNDIPKWFDGQGNSNNEFAGWYLDLIDPDDGDNHGEKAVTNARLRGDRVIFTTLIPSDSPCQFGGDSWLMELATEDGGRLGEPPFDLNDDAGFGSADMTDGGVIPSGIKSQKGIFSEATILQVPTGEVKLMSSSSGEVSAIQENPGDEDSGRQSWEELK